MELGSALPKKQGQRRTAYLLFTAGCILLVLAFVMGTSDNPPAIVSMLLGLFALVLGIIYFFAVHGRRKPGLELLYWAPRALCMVFALLISMLALDVFGEGRGFWQTLLALTMHLIPTFLLLMVLWASWRREWIGGTLFPLLGVLYILWAWNKPFGTWSVLLLMAGPLVVTGALFLLSWHYRSELSGKA
jgi:hypothetical protein